MPLTDENELALATEAKRGNAQALATLLQMNYAVVYRYLVKLTMDARAAEDAAQDAMERAVRSIRSFDPEKAKFSTWLIAVARNRWLDEIRKNRRLQPLSERPPAGGETGTDPYEELIEADGLLRALKGVDPRIRTPITMYHVLGYSYEEIAKSMKVPLGTVKSRISNGLKQLRREMTEHGA